MLILSIFSFLPFRILFSNREKSFSRSQRGYILRRLQYIASGKVKIPLMTTACLDWDSFLLLSLSYTFLNPVRAMILLTWHDTKDRSHFSSLFFFFFKPTIVV